MNNRIERSFLRIRQQLGPAEDSLARVLGPRFPLVKVGIALGKFGELLLCILLTLIIALTKDGLFLLRSLSRAAEKSDNKRQYRYNNRSTKTRQLVSYTRFHNEPFFLQIHSVQ